MLKSTGRKIACWSQHVEVIEQWTNHERWCVRALTQGAEHLLLAGSFNNSLDDSEDDSDSDGDDFAACVEGADAVA